MISLSILSDMILLLGIIAGGILFCCVNINYQPDTTEKSENDYEEKN